LQNKPPYSFERAIYFLNGVVKAKLEPMISDYYAALVSHDPEIFVSVFSAADHQNFSGLLAKLLGDRDDDVVTQTLLHLALGNPNKPQQKCTDIRQRLY